MRGLDRPTSPEGSADRPVAIAMTVTGEAFIPHGSPYLGQAVLGEPVRQINVLSPNRRQPVTKPASAAAALAAPCPSLFSDSGSLAQDLVEAFLAVRNETERRAAPLTPEDQLIQSMPDASPAKWHRAHTTWFFEQFLLGEHCEGYRPFHPGLRLSVQFLLCQRRTAARPPPARPSDPSGRRRSHRLSPACRRRRGEILPRRPARTRSPRSRRWSKSASITSSSIRN